MKVCVGCNVERPIEAWYPRFRGPCNKLAKCRYCLSEGLRRRRHGLTADEKTAIAIARGGCAACGSMETGGKGWVVDHDHRCCPGEQSCVKCRRGILCTYCNSALGYAKDDPARLRAMANYLDRTAAVSRTSEEVIGYATRISESESVIHTDGRTDGLTDVSVTREISTSPAVTRTSACLDFSGLMAARYAAANR
jgi:hypothetical protein